MWKGLVEWAGAQMLRPGFELASAQDLKIPRCVDTGAQAVALVREHHERWLSARCAQSTEQDATNGFKVWTAKGPRVGNRQAHQRQT